MLWLMPLAACNRGGTNGAAGSREDLNVLLVTIDTLRADHVGAYGATGAETPNLDGLAKEGVLFEAAIASVPITLPSHTSLMTGLTPPRHGVRMNGLFRLEDDLVTLAERFRDAGYQTAAVIGAAVLHGRYGLAQGFDLYDDKAFTSPSSRDHAERKASDVTDAALSWLSTRPRPFFCWVHYYDPHGAYEPPSPYRERFAGRPYDGEIAYVDAELGRLLGELRDQGILDRTLVIATADHGESLGEHGEQAHTHTLYDAAMHVPLIVRGPDVPSGKRATGVVSLMDVTASILAAANLDPLADSDGQDLQWRSDVALGASGRQVYEETLATKYDHGWAPLYAVRTDQHLYIRAPRSELYDVVQDPKQLKNLLEAGGREDRKIAVALDTDMDRLLAAERPGARVALDAQSRAQLQSLGYTAHEEPVPDTGMDPKDGLPLLKRYDVAKAHYESERYEQAEAAAQTLLVDLPESPRLHDLMARIYLRNREPSRAMPHAEKAVRLLPKRAGGWELRGTLHLAFGDVANAVKDYARAVELEPLPKALAGLMWQLELGGSLEDAARHASAAIEADPTDVEVRMRVASAWSRFGEHDHAREVFRQILDLDPDQEQAHMGLAMLLVREGSLQEAEAHLARAGDAAQDRSFQLRLAMIYAERGEKQRAVELLRELVKNHPDWDAPREALAKVEGNTSP